MRSIRGFLSEEMSETVCSFVGARSRKVLTRGILRHVINSGGTCRITEDSGGITSVALYLEISYGSSVLVYVTHFVGKSFETSELPRNCLVQHIDEPGKEANKDRILFVSAERDVEYCSFRPATYNEYVRTESDGMVAKMNESSWNAIDQEKYTCLREGEIVCVIILWPTVFAEGDSLTACVSLCTIAVEHSFGERLVLDSICNVAKQVYDVKTVAILAASGICLPQSSFASKEISKRAETDVLFVC